MKKLLISTGWIVALALLVATSVAAQIRLQKAVVSDAGGSATNGTTRMQFTVGQTAAAHAVNGSTVGAFGFWNGAATKASARSEAGNPIRSLAVSPNPASANIEIRLVLANAGDLDLSLYDAAGHLASTVFSGRSQAGTFTKRCQISDLACGAYYLTARIPGAISETRFTIVR